MILALIILWVLASAVFFGSLIVIASVPTPPVEITATQEYSDQPQHSALSEPVMSATSHAA